jgi:hypothetical protein
MPDATTPNLLHCRFCGSTDANLHDENFHNFVECGNCEAKGPAFSYDETDSMDKAIAAWNQPSPWQPIETAPRDGTDFIAYNEFTGPYITAAKSIFPIAAPPDGTIRFPMHYWHGQKGTWFPEPTHWQPLPSPPITPSPHA